MDIHVNIAEVQSVISGVTSALQQNIGTIGGAYNTMAGNFADSSGEEAEALRQLQQKELEMLKEMIDTLSKFGQSIQFAADSHGELDSTGAKSMYR